MKSGVRELFRNLFGIGEKNNINLSSEEVIENSGAISVELESVLSNIDNFGDTLFSDKSEKKERKNRLGIKQQAKYEKGQTIQVEKNEEEHKGRNDEFVK